MTYAFTAFVFTEKKPEDRDCLEEMMSHALFENITPENRGFAEDPDGHEVHEGKTGFWVNRHGAFDWFQMKHGGFRGFSDKPLAQQASIKARELNYFPAKSASDGDRAYFEDVYRAFEKPENPDDDPCYGKLEKTVVRGLRLFRRVFGINE